MPTTAPALPAKKQIAKITSKGQITIPAEMRELLGVKPGDRLIFEPTPEGIKIVRLIDENPLENMRGMGNWLPDGYHGREGIIRYFRELRGHDEIDDLIFGTEP